MVSSGETTSSPFAVTAAANTVRLDDKQQAVTTFTVSNASGRPLNGRARLRSDSPAAAGWLTLAGEADRLFAPNQASQYSVNIAVPLGSPPGSYSFSLDMIGVDNPDELFSQGPPVTIEVPAVEVVKKGLPSWWWIPVAVVGVLIIAVVAFVVLRKGDSSEPFTDSRTFAASGVIDLDSDKDINQESRNDDLQYLEAGQTHIILRINQSRMVSATTGAITFDQCKEAAKDKSLDVGSIQLSGTTPVHICVATNSGAVSLVTASLVTPGGPVGPVVTPVKGVFNKDAATKFTEQESKLSVSNAAERAKLILDLGLLVNSGPTPTVSKLANATVTYETHPE